MPITIGDRIKQLRGTENQDAFSERFSVSKATVLRYETGKTAPDIPFIRQLCQYYGVTSDWLIFGDESEDINSNDQSCKFADIGNSASKDREFESDLLNDLPARMKRIGEIYHDKSDYPVYLDKYSYVPVVSNKLTSDGASFQEDNFPVAIDYLAFRRDWLVRLGRPKNLRIMEVKGDAMSPTLQDSDLVLFDISRVDWRLGKIYAVAFDGIIHLRRLYLSDDEELYKADNEKHPVLKAKTSENFKARRVYVIGQVIWWCHAEHPSEGSMASKL